MSRTTNTSRRLARHVRVRRKIHGTADRPRLAVFRSLNHIYAQIIDDTKGETLIAASSLDSDVQSEISGKRKADVSTLVGNLVASRAKSKGVKAVVFDRGGFLYHGRVRSVAEAAREAGLEF